VSPLFQTGKIHSEIDLKYIQRRDSTTTSGGSLRYHLEQLASLSVPKAQDCKRSNSHPQAQSRVQLGFGIEQEFRRSV
jgi:hypothetical protein